MYLKYLLTASKVKKLEKSEVIVSADMRVNATGATCYNRACRKVVPFIDNYSFKRDLK